MNVVVSPPTTIPRRVVADRGSWAMAMFIATEAMLFVCLFFSYFYLGHAQPKWPPEPPKYMLALVMLAILVSSSFVLHWGESQVKQGRQAAGRGATLVTILLGLVFIAVQVKEYAIHLRELQPTTDAYGSIFYTITSVHGAHVLLGLAMLAYVLALPEIGEGEKPPHRPLHNASLYWHFVDVVWLFIVALLYLAPNLAR
jgi:heme/copper-type cytochrome/quinol oxidase subunit 3